MTLRQKLRLRNELRELRTALFVGLLFGLILLGFCYGGKVDYEYHCLQTNCEATIK